MRILVTGMHRSGTSLVTQLINAMGAGVGAENMLMKPMPDNPRGFWERRDIAALNERVLAAQGRSWDAPIPAEKSEIPDHLNRRREEILHRLDTSQPWVAKDPRFCLTLDFWLRSGRSFHVVVVHRNPLETARSLKARNGTSVHRGLALWEYYLKSLHQILHDFDVPRVAVSHEDVLSDLEAVAEQLLAALQTGEATDLQRPSSQTLGELVEPSLRRQVASDSDARAWLRPDQQHYWESLPESRAEILEPTEQTLDLLRGHVGSAPLPEPTDPDRLAERIEEDQRTVGDQLAHVSERIAALNGAVAAVASAIASAAPLSNKLGGNQPLLGAEYWKLTAQLSASASMLQGLNLSWESGDGLNDIRARLQAARHLAHLIRSSRTLRLATATLHTFGFRSLRSKMNELCELLDSAQDLSWLETDRTDIRALAIEISEIASELAALDTSGHNG